MRYVDERKMRDRRRERQHRGRNQGAREDRERTKHEGLTLLVVHGVPRFAGLHGVVLGLAIIGGVVLPERASAQSIVGSDDDAFGVDVSGTLAERVKLGLG